MAGRRADAVHHVLRVKLRRVFMREKEGGEDFAKENLDVTAKATLHVHFRAWNRVFVLLLALTVTNEFFHETENRVYKLN